MSSPPSNGTPVTAARRATSRAFTEGDVQQAQQDVDPVAAIPRLPHGAKQKTVF
jgi:hypothetical protein